MYHHEVPISLERENYLWILTFKDDEGDRSFVPSIGSSYTEALHTFIINADSYFARFTPLFGERFAALPDKSDDQFTHDVVISNESERIHHSEEKLFLLPFISNKGNNSYCLIPARGKDEIKKSLAREYVEARGYFAFDPDFILPINFICDDRGYPHHITLQKR